jgi:hypothetical protein
MDAMLSVYTTKPTACLQATIPTRCIPVHLKRYLYARTAEGSTQLLRDRYEFLIYQLVRAALEAGDIFCHRSVRFRSIEDDLIPSAEWKKHKAEYLAETQLPLLQQPIAEHWPRWNKSWRRNSRG